MYRIKHNFNISGLGNADFEGQCRQNAKCGVIGNRCFNANGHIASIFNAQTAHGGIANANLAKIDILGENIEQGHAECGIAQFADEIVGGINKNEIPIAIN